MRVPTTFVAASPAAHVACFHEHLAKGRWEQALDDIARLQKESPAEQGVCFFLTGLFFLQKGYAGRALQAMEAAFRAEPTSRECLYGVAMANSALGFYQEVLFCNKISATTREIAHERGWGDLLTPSLRDKDRLLFVTDEQIILTIAEKHRQRGDFDKAASVAEDALLVFEKNHAWRRVAIVNHLAANRPFAAAALLQPFAARSPLSLEDQLLTAEVFAGLGKSEECLLWLERIATAEKTHGGCRAALAKLLFFSPPPFSKRMLSVRRRIESGLPSAPRRKNTKYKVVERLRIGIVSADLFIGGLVERVALLFEMFDKTNIEFFLYIDSPHQDSLTEHFMAFSKDHYQTHAVDDATFARIVHEDEIDVLLDLDLRSITRRPAVARLKPASLHVVAFADPHHAHRWGYDAVLSDPFLSPTSPARLSKSTPAKANHDKHTTVDTTTPCPVIRPRCGFLQAADLFDVQPTKPSPRKTLRVGLSAAYATLDSVAQDLLVRCMLEVPRFELLFDSESLGGEKAAAALLTTLEKTLPHEQHDRFQILPEHTSLEVFLQQTDLLLDIAFPRSAYMVWQCLRHAVPVLTLKGATIPERMGFSVAAQMGMQDLCVCEDDENLLARLRVFCSNAQHRQTVRKALQRQAKLLKNQKQMTQKALSVVEALFEGVVVLGKTGRYQPSHGMQAP